MKHHVNHSTYNERLKQMIRLMENTLDDIKRLTKELRPQLVDHLGLASSLETITKEWEMLYKIDIDLDIQLDHALPFEKDEGLHLFRIIQESVTNAVKHGKADHIKIELRSEGNNIYFQITDNGKGFDPSVSKQKGLGMKHIKERVNMLHGDVKWISQEGGPTRVEGIISIHEGENQ